MRGRLVEEVQICRRKIHVVWPFGEHCPWNDVLHLRYVRKEEVVIILKNDFFFGRKNWSAVRIESDRKSPRLSENKKNCDDLLSQEEKLRTCHAIIFDNV